MHAAFLKWNIKILCISICLRATYLEDEWVNGPEFWHRKAQQEYEQPVKILVKYENYLAAKWKKIKKKLARYKFKVYTCIEKSRLKKLVHSITSIKTRIEQYKVSKESMVGQELNKTVYFSHKITHESIVIIISNILNILYIFYRDKKFIRNIKTSNHLGNTARTNDQSFKPHKKVKKLMSNKKSPKK